ncbi:hypothetical protein TRIUR3_29375 [Triticum urartu]|uniref:Uncharacterized protein n=1 Tax=Triticum urartu TaxID=4572 RepID=M7YV73_TRIUA|nr:hypothetical protein TRIUR3_29375 [Triticum urartu]
MPQQLAQGGGVPCTGSNPVDLDMDAAGFELQMVPWHGGNNDGLLGEDRFQMQPGCGFQCIGGGNYSGAVDETLALGSGNAGYDWTDLTMWHTGELRDAVLPLGNYPAFADCTPAPEYSAQVVAGGDYMKTLPTGYGYPMAMGVGNNFTLGSNYTARWQVEESHRSGTSTIEGEVEEDSIQQQHNGVVVVVEERARREGEVEEDSIQQQHNGVVVVEECDSPEKLWPYSTSPSSRHLYCRDMAGGHQNWAK